MESVADRVVVMGETSRAAWRSIEYCTYEMLFSLEKLSCTLPLSPMPATRLKRRAHFPARAASARYTAPALDKGLDILELFASEPDGLTTSQVARRLGRTVGEIFRMLVCLAERGYISQVLPDEHFQL